jgi:hypothetical protein
MNRLRDKAAGCDRLANLQTDPVEKTTLRFVRQMWKALADKSSSMTEEELSSRIAEIEKTQSGILSGMR